MHSNHSVGLLFGVLFGGAHLLWSVLVALGLGQALIDFVFWAHMAHVAVLVGPFDATAAVTLVIVTALIGYVLGYVGATIWKKLH